MSISESGFMSVNKTSSPDDASTTLSREKREGPTFCK